MINLTTETSLRLNEAARLVGNGRGGKPTHISTVLRWILKGVKAPSGEIVRLEGLRVGSRWVTTREALQRFATRLTPDLDTKQVTPVSSAARRKAAERAERELARNGI
jgi:hypothetical protein